MVVDTADHLGIWVVVVAVCLQWVLHLTWLLDTPILIPTLIPLHLRAVVVVVDVLNTVADPHHTVAQEVPCHPCLLVDNPIPCTTPTTLCTTPKWRVLPLTVCLPVTPCPLVILLAAVMVVVAVGDTGAGVPGVGAGAGVGHQGGAGLLVTVDTLPAGTDPDPVHPHTEEDTPPDTVPLTLHHAAPEAGPPPLDVTIWQHMVVACL